MDLVQVFNILFILYVLMVLYLVFKVLRRKHINKKYDLKFNVQTTGYRYLENKKLYNRTESTPYLALETLAKRYKVSEGDRMVDFGAGKGRISIYLNYKMNIPVTGIELNELTLKEANDNLANYKEKFDVHENDLSFKLDYAEKYEIQEDENLFFFFNPFHTAIFKKVIKNIIENAEENQKQVDVILYYPVDGFQKHLNEETPFKLIDEFKSDGLISRREKFMIYRYKPE